MKHVDSDTYSIAWFKLADCIARGEKERALGVFRLLSHSFDDSALAAQLYGDILRSFKDPAAREKYEQAAQLYRERKRWIEAAAVYEHIISLEPENYDVRMELIELYQHLHIRSKVMQYVQELMDALLAKNEWQQAIEICGRFDTAGDPTFTATLHERILFHLLTQKNILPETMLSHAQQAIDAWNMVHNSTAVTNLLSKLKAAHETVAEHAQAYAARVTT